MMHLGDESILAPADAALCPWCGDGLEAAAKALREDEERAAQLGFPAEAEEDEGAAQFSEFVAFALCASCLRTWQGRALWATDRLIATPWKWVGRLVRRGRRGLIAFVGGDRYRTVPVAHTDLYCRRTARGEARLSRYLRRLFRAAVLCRRFGHLIDGTELGSGGDGVDGWCARCDHNVLLSASAVRWLREGGAAPELFATWDRLGLTPERPRSVEVGGEESGPEPA